MKEILQRIWELAWPYQDKRGDRGHAEITLDYAKTLVRLENGDGDIVIPAIILHDIGWSQVPRAKRFLIFDGNAREEEKISARLQHESAGVELAGDILSKVGYPADLTEEILGIVAEHDTREEYLSVSEGLVSDADKLWRFSEVGFGVDIRRYKLSPEMLFRKLEADFKNPVFFYSRTARQLAYEELELRGKLI